MQIIWNLATAQSFRPDWRYTLSSWFKLSLYHNIKTLSPNVPSPDVIVKSPPGSIFPNQQVFPPLRSHTLAILVGALTRIFFQCYFLLPL